jgi:F-type H+-transporting ATPase subunit delta
MADEAAIPYAEALFEAADAAGSLPATYRDLSGVVRSVAENRDLSRVLFNPAFPPDAKRRVLTQMTAGGDPLVGSFLAVLIEHGRLDLLADAFEAFADSYRRRQRELAVHLTTAIPIDDAVADGLRAQLEQATGQSVEMTRAVDPAILGGIVLRVRDLLVDASVRRRLDALRLSLATTRLPSGGEA